MDTRDTFRPFDAGDVTIDVNTKRMNQDRFIDQSRIGTHAEWEPSKNPMKPGRDIQVKDNPVDNARLGCDAMKHRSSFTDESSPRRDGGVYGCYPFCNSEGPMTRRRGGN